MPPIKEFWNFANEVSVPTEFTERENGNGTVSINSDHLKVTSGGTSSGDTAAAVLTSSLDTSKMYVIYGECKLSGNAGSFAPAIVSLVNSSGVPALQTAANRDAALRMWQEYQMSSGADATDRIQARFKNESDSAHWNYVASTSTWQSAFAYTRAFFDEDSYYRFVIVYDGTVSPARARTLVYGYTETGAERGWNINYDSTWLDFDTGSGNIDPVDDDLYVVFGDLTNDEAPAATWTFDYRRIMVGEMVTANVEEFAFTNKGTSPFPYDYNLYAYVNPMPDDQTFWVSRHYDGFYPGGDDTDTKAISRGSDHWVKDPHVFYDGTSYWMVCQFRDASTTDSEIWVYDTSDILNGTWSNANLISSPGAGEDKHEFPWLTKYSTTWYLFYGVELTAGGWEIQYKTSTAANPRSGWSSSTQVLTAGAGGSFDDGGVTQPFLVWHSGTFTGGTWYLIYAGENGSAVWEGGIAKSTTGITGSYERAETSPFFATEAFSTQLDGNHTDLIAVTVDSTTGLNEGDMIYIDDPRHIAEVVSVDSGTQFTASIELTENDNDFVRSFSYHSFAPRLARRINNYWVIYGTAFKFSGGYESVSVYVATTTEAVLEDCTFRQLRVGDTPIDFVIPPIPLNDTSNENLGGVFSELTPAIPYTWPFSDSFTGSNNDPWSANKWTTSVNS